MTACNGQIGLRSRRAGSFAVMCRADDDAVCRYVRLGRRPVHVLVDRWNEEQGDEEQSRDDIDGIVKAFSHLIVDPERQSEASGPAPASRRALVPATSVADGALAGPRRKY